MSGMMGESRGQIKQAQASRRSGPSVEYRGTILTLPGLPANRQPARHRQTHTTNSVALMQHVGQSRDSQRLLCGVRRFHSFISLDAKKLLTSEYIF